MNSVAYWVLHASLILFIGYSRFDAAVISIALLIAIFSNLGSSDHSSPYSAYSIFNKGCRYLLGEARADQLDRQIRGGTRTVQPGGDEDERSVLNIPSKFINRPCPCGSGLKAKKCHAMRRTRNEKSSEKANNDDSYDYTGFEVIKK